MSAIAGSTGLGTAAEGLSGHIYELSCSSAAPTAVIRPLGPTAYM